MDIKKVLGYGIVLWVVIFAAISILGAIGFAPAWLTALVAIIAVYFVATKYQSQNFTKGISAGAVWVVIGLILDYFVTRRYAADIFSQWNVWLGYVAILLLPALLTQKTKQTAQPAEQPKDEEKTE